MASKWATTKASEFCKELRSSGVGDLTGKQERAIAASYDAAAEETMHRWLPAESLSESAPAPEGGDGEVDPFDAWFPSANIPIADVHMARRAWNAALAVAKLPAPEGMGRDVTYSPATRVLELYYAQKDGCKKHGDGCGKICLNCVEAELAALAHPTSESGTRTPAQEVERVMRDAETLLEWVPTCSPGSSGYIRTENLRKSLADLKFVWDGSLNGSCRQEASRESDTGGETHDAKAESGRVEEQPTFWRLWQLWCFKRSEAFIELQKANAPFTELQHAAIEDFTNFVRTFVASHSQPSVKDKL